MRIDKSLLLASGRFTFCLLVGIVTHQSLTPIPASIFSHWSDKLLHVGAWLVVAIAFGLAFPKLKKIQASFWPLFGYSILIEIGQFFVPGRSFSGLDILANGTGCALGLLIAVIGLRRLST